MRALLVLPLAMLAGCGPELGQSRHSHGRYEGIGIGPAGDAWRKLADAPKPGDKRSATLADDDYLIVVTDSQTGEVRECGDRSGFCVRLDPWKADAPLAPLAVTEHTQHKSGEQSSEPDNASIGN